MGNPWVRRPKDRADLEAHNNVLLFILEIIRCCLAGGIWLVLEMAENSFLCPTKGVRGLRKRIDIISIGLDQCRVGARNKRPALLLSN